MASCPAVRKGHLALSLAAIIIMVAAAGLPAAPATPPAAAASAADTNLAALTTAFTTAAATRQLTVAPGATCWYIGVPGADAVCGPVAAPGDPVDGHWQNATVGAGPTSPPVLGATGRWLPDGTVLVGDHGLRRIVRRPGGDGEIIKPGDVAQLTDPGITLVPPADGRLGSFDQLLTVTGTAVAHSAGPPGGRITAGPGRLLIVATVTTHRQILDVPDIFTVAAANITIVADGQTLPITLGGAAPNTDGAVTLAVSVPDTHPQARLQLAQDGLTQTFDLTAGRRTDPSFTALYRAGGSPWLDVTTPTVTAHFTSEYFGDSHDPIAVRAVLGAFALTGRTPAPVTDRTAATVRVATVVAASGSGTGAGQLDPGAVHVHVDAPTPTTATAVALDNTASPVSASFTVPAETTRLTVTIDPGGAHTNQSRTNADPLTFAVDLPTAAPPTPATPGPDITAVLAADAATLVAPGAAPTSQRASSGSPFKVIAPIVAVIAAALALVTISRRRRPPRPTAAAWDAVTAPASAPPHPSPAPAEGNVPAAGPTGSRASGSVSTPSDRTNGSAPHAPHPASPDGSEHEPAAPTTAVPTGTASPAGPEHERATAAATPDPAGTNPTGNGTDPRVPASESAAAVPPTTTANQPTTPDSALAPGSSVAAPTSPVAPRETVQIAKPRAPFVVRVLGPVTADGWIEPTDRAAILALACWLAFHRDRPRSGAEVTEALWPLDGSDAAGGKADTVRTFASRLRQAIGADRFPPAPNVGGYLLVGDVTTDIELFDDLVAHANGDPDQAVDHLAAALAHVRGTPFEGSLADPFYQWVTAEGWEAKAVIRVTDTARRLARLHEQRGDIHDARISIRKGLELNLQSSILREDMIRLATDRAELDIAWREAVSALGPAEAERTLGATYRLHGKTDR